MHVPSSKLVWQPTALNEDISSRISLLVLPMKAPCAREQGVLIAYSFRQNEASLPLAI